MWTDQYFTIAWANLSVHVRSIHVDLATVLVDDPADLVDSLLVHT